MNETIYEALRAVAEARPQAPAILAVDREPLSFAELLQQVDAVAATLEELPLAPGARVAVALPDGPETAVAFLACVSAFAYLPLNPAFREDEVKGCLARSRADALLVPAAGNRPARRAAQRLGIAVVELGTLPRAAAGRFTLNGREPSGRGPTRRARPADAALVMHTSGTTSKPSLVRLDHAHLRASARHIIDHFRLTAADRRLNVMPLFHIQGLVGGVLSSILAGGSIVCTEGFDAAVFLDHLQSFRPTWYSAVPTLHALIMARVRDDPRKIAGHSLRFIRNGSFSLTGAARVEIEEAFGVPVLESYGMTETASQITCNPLPPAARKAGSVGRVAGPEVRILDSDFEPLPAGESGEIAVRGPNVIRSYELSGDASGEHFVRGWLRTGDLGHFDDDGYLFISGRVKDMINRGGEKVSPGEVERVLREHGAVREAAVFAVADATLGEEVAAAVVREHGSAVSRHQLQVWVGERLADFKVPRHLDFVATLPRGITGKILRHQLARAFAPGDRRQAAEEHEPIAPHDDVERRLAEIWADMLGFETVGVTDDFYRLGGDSLLLARLMARTNIELGHALPMTALLPDPTIRGLARRLRRQTGSDGFEPLVLLQRGDQRAPLFCIHPAGGSVMAYANLVRSMSPEQPVYGLQAPGMEGVPRDHESVEQLASRYLEIIRRVQPRGPLRLAGHSLGGIVAFEMSRQLQASGEEIALLAVIDAMCPTSEFRRLHETFILAFLQELETSDLADFVDLEADAAMWSALFRLMGGEREDPHAGANRDRHRELFLSRLVQFGFLRAEEDLDDLVLRRFLRSLRSGFRAAHAYIPEPAAVDMVYFRAGAELPEGCLDPALGWAQYAEKGVDVAVLEANHFDIFSLDKVGQLASRLQQCLDRIAD